MLTHNWILFHIATLRRLPQQSTTTYKNEYFVPEKFKQKSHHIQKTVQPHSLDASVEHTVHRAKELDAVFFKCMP